MNIEELKRLAEANYGWRNADSAWPHQTNDGSAVVGNIDDEHDQHVKNPIAVVDLTIYDAFEGDSLQLAQFYAAANPAAVLALIAEVESLRDQVNGLTGTADRAEKQRDELLAELKNLEYAFSLATNWHNTNWHTRMKAAIARMEASK